MPSTTAPLRLSRTPGPVNRKPFNESRVRRDHGRFSFKPRSEPSSLPAPTAPPDYAVDAPGFDSATGGGDVIVTRDEDNQIVSLTRGDVSFIVPRVERQRFDRWGDEWIDTGDRYDPALTTGEIARKVELDIDAARAVGWLPDNLDYSVTNSAGQVDVAVDGIPPDTLHDPSSRWRTRHPVIGHLHQRVNDIRLRYQRSSSGNEPTYAGQTTIIDRSRVPAFPSLTAPAHLVR